MSEAVSNGDWAEFSEIKFTVPDDSTNVYLYFECSDTAVMYVDDFEVRTVASAGIEEDIPSLKDVYANYFKVGTAVTTTELAPKSAKDLILKHFNSITLGNELKPDAILDQDATLATGSNTDPQVNIASARTILNFARDNNISVRGHVLVWHQQTPDWFFKEGFQDSGDWVSKEVMLERMENYIKNVFAAVTSEYPTVDFYAWDVVNEAWLDDGSVRPAGVQSDSYKNSPWVKVFGDNSFIEYAFTYARKYAPDGCKLYYNDYNEYIPAKTEAICNMVSELKEKGLIDGIGMQSHLDVRSGSDAYPTVAMYRQALEKFAALDVDIQITELDATVNDELYEEQAQYYSDIMDAIVEYKDSISAVVFWGTTDDKSWRSAYTPLLFYSDFSAKPAFYAIIDDVDDVEPTEGTTTSSVTTTTTSSTTTTITSAITETTSGEVGREYIPGDVTQDGKLNGFDATVMRYALLNNLEASSLTEEYDMNGDGDFTVSDFVELTKHLLQY
jgi:endo-1,4-beta-xylanase